MNEMRGSLQTSNGVLRGGFIGGINAPDQSALGPSIPLGPRAVESPAPSPELANALASIQRGSFTGDVNSILLQLGQSMQEFQRTIQTSLMPTNLPVRENLEAESKLLIPTDTPIRNRLPRHRGSGLASDWYVTTSLGGGYTGYTTTTGTNSSGATTLNVTSTAGFSAGEMISLDDTSTNHEVLRISAVASATALTVPALANTYTAASKVINLSRQPGSPQGMVRAFFAETGAPAAHQTTYERKSASYRLLGTYGSVTGFAQAVGANFMNQLAAEKTNAIRNLMLNEEYALLNADGTSTAAPWGDGSTALAFTGIIPSISGALGTPWDQIQESVGDLSLYHIDSQLRRLFMNGAQGVYMVMNPQEAISLTKLAEAQGSIIRVQATSDGKTVLGVNVTGYVNPITGEMIDIIPSRFVSPGTILYLSERMPDGSPVMDVDVLPQVQLPELAPNENVQGYVAQELAPTHTAPQVYAFIVSVFEVLRVKSHVHLAKSTGVNPITTP